MLQAELGIWIPARIEKHEQRLDVVTRGDREKSVDAILEAGGILLPDQIMKEHAHRVHPHVFGPAQLLVDLSWIEGRRLPHLQLVDCVRRNVVAADQPRLLLVPRPGFLLRPA